MKACMNAYDQDGELTQPRTPMNNDIAKDAARIKRLAEGAALAILTADNDSSFSAAEVEAVARPIRETLEAWNTRATAADKDRIAETAEAWEQLAFTFPAIQVDCNDQIEAAQFIVAEYEKLRAQLAEKTQGCEGLRVAIKAVIEAYDVKAFDSTWGPEQPLWDAVFAALDSARKEGE